MAASGSVPPPKPWERVGSSSGPSPFRPSSTGSTSTVVESSGVAKTGESTDTERNVPLANRSTIGRPMPTRPWEQGSYGSNYGGLGSMTNYNSGYGSMTNYNSGYGSGLYGSNNSYGGMGGGYGAMSGSYGGGLYGNNMYRGGYGGSNMFGGMYNNGMGGPMGGYGMGPGGPYDNGNGNPNDPFGGPPSPPSFWQSMLRVGLDFTSLLELDRTKEVKQWRVGNISLLGKDGCLEVWIFLQTIVASVVLYLQPYLYLLYPYDPVVPMHGVVTFFGRISILVDQNTQAFHFFMTALLQLFDRTGVLYGELARFVLRLLGIRTKPRGPSRPGPKAIAGQGPPENYYIEEPKEAAGGWENVWEG